MTELMRRRRALMGQAAGSPAPVHGTWGDLFRAIDAGTHATEYSVGEIIPLDLGTEGIVNAQIAAFNTDTISDSTDTAPVTFIAQHLLATSKRFNPARSGSSGNYTEGTGCIGGWLKSELRAYLHDTVKPLFPSNVGNRLVSVKKYSYGVSTAGAGVNNVLSNDYLWIPNYRETGKSGVESSGVSGYTVLDTNDKRLRKKPGAASGIIWFLRSGFTGSGNTIGANVWVTAATGVVNGTQPASSSYGVLLGFCVG